MIRSKFLFQPLFKGFGPGQKLRRSSLAMVASLFVLFLAIAPMGFAQGTGSISGYVRDASGGGLPNTTVTAVMTEQSTTRTAQTDAQGFYNFVALPAGHYKITFEAKGFEKLVRSDVELTVSQNARADAQLNVGTVQSEVHVSSTVPLVDTTSNTLSGLVDDRRVVDLPLNGRNVIGLAALIPGVTNVSAPQNMSDARGGPEMNVNGSLPNATVYTFDGAYFNNPSRNTGLNFPPPDAIAQFRILTSNFSAEYGHSSGAQVEVVSRAGTDSFHGSAFEFLRNDAFNAKDYFADSVPSEKQNQFGGAIGGPILKRRLFFFGSFQRLVDHGSSEGTQAQVPSAAERAGDFTESPNELFNPTDPLTGLPFTAPGGAPCVVGKIINPGCINPAAVSLLAFVPESPTGTVTSQAPSPITDNTGSVRIDWNQSSKNLIFGHYYQDNTSIVSPFSGYDGGNIAGYVANTTAIKTQNGVVNDIYSFSPTLINQAIFSVLNTTTNEANNQTHTNASLNINMPQYVPTGAVAANVGNQFILDSGYAIVFSGVNYQFSDNLSWTRGRHNFEFGYELLKLHFYQSYIAPAVFTFSGVRTQNPDPNPPANAPASGDPVADFLLGAYDNLTLNFGVRVNDDRTAYNSFYARDSFRVNPRVTLNYGLRYEPFLQWKDGNGKLNTIVPGQQSTIDPTAPPGILFIGDKGVGKGIAQANLGNVAPRVGFAWDVFGDGKTSVRGGYGVFFNSINANEVAQENAPYAGFTNANHGNLTDPITSTGQVNPPIAPSGQFGCVSIPTYPFYSCSLFPLPIEGFLAISKTLHLPRYQEYSFSVQRQITPTTMIEVSYVGNTGAGVHGRVPFNPAQFINDPITGDPPSETNAPNRVIYEPGILGATNRTMENFAHSNYNALQIQGTKRFGHGSTILANYTRARSLDANSTNNNNANVPNPFNLRAGYGPSDSDHRNSFVVSWLYSLPFHFENKLTNSLLGGWSLTAIQTVQSGAPITFFAGQDVALDGTGENQYAQLAPGATASTVRISHPNRTSEVSRFFNTQAFVPTSNEPAGIYGNVSRGFISGPAYANTDASLLKDFALPKTFLLQFRAESFNTFNQVNFSNPNSTANSGGFGQIQSTVAHTGRQLQLALKLLW